MTSYTLTVTYKNYDPSFDSKIKSTVGRQMAGSGYGFGMRDISFEFKQESAAKKALSRVKRLRKYQLKAELLKESDD